MTLWQFLGLLCGSYLVLLARSAWKQGEIRQFLWSFLVVLLLGAAVAGAVALAAWVEHR